MRKIFQTCENQISENEVMEKIRSLRCGTLSSFSSYHIVNCWDIVLDKPLYERVISRFKYDRFNYYAIQAYREYFLDDDRVSTKDILMFEEEKYSDTSIFKFFSKEPMFRSFYAESVLYFRELLNGNVDSIYSSEFGFGANESNADSASLGEMISDLNHCRTKSDEQPTEQPTEQTDEQKNIEELAKKLSEFVHLYNTAFDKFKRLKG